MHPQHPTPETDYLPDAGDYNRLVDFKRRGVDPFGAYYVTQDDIIVLKTWSPQVSATVNVSIRLQTPEGIIVPMFSQFIGLTVGTTPNIKVLAQMEGYILSATIETPTTQRGNVFCALEVQRGQGSGDIATGQLLVSGYPGQGFAVGYPQSPPAGPLDGRGLMLVQTVSNPAAGADWSFTIPAGVQMILRTCAYTLTTSATAANRLGHLQMTDGSGHMYFNGISNGAIIASVTGHFTGMIGGTTTSSDNTLYIATPAEWRMQPGHILQSLTTNLQAGDQYSQIVLGFEQFISA